MTRPAGLLAAVLAFPAAVLAFPAAPAAAARPDMPDPPSWPVCTAGAPVAADDSVAETVRMAMAAALGAASAAAWTRDRRRRGPTAPDPRAGPVCTVEVPIAADDATPLAMSAESLPRPRA
ncbi:hypothetical protein [Paractinoplanes brasiliensis]|uniref:Uncharacterized protein n=1 Tax=Paractinoplanes brasiliensis TaxID=52695 RepID=A0A4R6JZ38_9ACTN|nr:hypothetical protein [Actinoplanes brasiliensis]TDO42130.1 hypothetical protein C8E87_5893 [Actinoplanes brasiliensis]GID32006.1 hypothetical protein Abr02nite_69890 [Actinoplanes brasiliensis]